MRPAVTPYTHPSMPGTPPDFPMHVVRSPFGPPLDPDTIPAEVEQP